MVTGPSELHPGAGRGGADAERQASLRAEHPHELAHRGVDVFPEVRDVDREDRIEAAIFEGHRLHGGFVQIELRKLPPRTKHDVRAHVDAGHASGRLVLSHHRQSDAAAEADLEDSLVRLHVERTDAVRGDQSIAPVEHPREGPGQQTVRTRELGDDDIVEEVHALMMPQADENVVTREQAGDRRERHRSRSRAQDPVRSRPPPAVPSVHRATPRLDRSARRRRWRRGG